MKRLFASLVTFLLFTSCSLFNSANLSLRYTTPIEKMFGHNYRTKNIPSSVGITVKGVDHPSKFQPWDASFRFRPTAHLERVKFEGKDRKINNAGQEEGYYPDLLMIRTSAFANLEATGHTPLGAFSLVIGYGLTLAKFDDKDSIQHTTLTDVKKMELAYTGFIAERWYLNLSGRLFDEKILTASMAIKLGYYFSEDI